MLTVVLIVAQISKGLTVGLLDAVSETPSSKHACLINFISNNMNHLGSLKLLQNVEDGDDFIKRLAQTNIPTTQILNAPDTTNYSSFDNFLDSTSSYILYLKNSSLVNQTVDFLERMADWNMHATYLVILQDKCDPEQANRDIITALRFHTIATALADGDGVLRFYVYSPYAEENSCGQKQVATEVGSCMRRMTEMPKGVLPRDLKGCTFTVGWFGRSTPQARPTLRMFSAFGETFNLSIRFVKDDRHHQEYFTNGSLARGLNELSTGKLDLLGMFAVESRFYNTFRVVPTGRFECIYWLLPERRPISLFTLLITENLLVVLLLLALLIATTLTWRVVAHSKTLSDAFVSVARISMSYSLPSVPNNRTLKMFLMFCFAAFLPLDVSIQSFLTSTLTHPIFEPKISTDEELIRSDMPMKYQTYYLSVANMWQKELTAEMRARAIEKHVDMYKYDPEDFTGSKYMAVLIYSYMMLEPVKNQEDFEIIDTNVCVRTVYLMPKGHRLAPRLESFVQRVVEMGLTGRHGKWDFDYSFTEDQLMYVKTEYRTSPLRLRNVSGAFYILVLGSTVALVVFLFEMKMHRSQ